MKKPEYDLSLTSYPKIKKVITPIPNFPPIGSVVDSQRGVDEFVVPTEGIVILWQKSKRGGSIPLRRLLYVVPASANSVPPRVSITT